MTQCGKNVVDSDNSSWQYNTARALCVLDNKGYRHTLRICNTYWFSTAIMITRMLLYGIRLNVHFLYCSFFNGDYLLRANNLGNNLKAACEWYIYWVLFVLEYLKTRTPYVTRYFASQDSSQCASACLSVETVSIPEQQVSQLRNTPAREKVSDHLPRGRWA